MQGTTEDGGIFKENPHLQTFLINKDNRVMGLDRCLFSLTLFEPLSSYYILCPIPPLLVPTSMYTTPIIPNSFYFIRFPSPPWHTVIPWQAWTLIIYWYKCLKFSKKYFYFFFPKNKIMSRKIRANLFAIFKNILFLKHGIFKISLINWSINTCWRCPCAMVVVPNLAKLLIINWVTIVL